MYKLANAFRKDKSIIKKFDPMQIGIEPEDWALFLEQCKI
jgi:hypothetical protein